VRKPNASLLIQENDRGKRINAGRFCGAIIIEGPEHGKFSLRKKARAFSGISPSQFASTATNTTWEFFRNSEEMDSSSGSSQTQGKHHVAKRQHGDFSLKIRGMQRLSAGEKYEVTWCLRQGLSRRSPYYWPRNDEDAKQGHACNRSQRQYAARFFGRSPKPPDGYA